METKELKISTQTLMLIGCLKAQANLWGQVYDALVFIYGERQAGEIMEEQYNSAHDGLRKVISNFLTDSITDKMLGVNFVEI